MKKDVFCCITSRGQNNSDGESNLRLSESTPQLDTEPQRLSWQRPLQGSCVMVGCLHFVAGYKAIFESTNYTILFHICSLLSSGIVPFRPICLSHTWLISTLLDSWDISPEVSLLTVCEKTKTSKSICIILMQSGPIFKHFALEVYKLARMDGWDILRKQMLTEAVDYEGEM